jgi:AAA+ ATPase superfamily predicted ATPase
MRPPIDNLATETKSLQLIGRSAEQSVLHELLKSDQAEFLAIYGRRRIGKTFLIREYFKDKEAIFFNSTGSKDGSLIEQIHHFTKEIGKVFYGGIKLEPGKNWDSTFEILTKAIENSSVSRKIVLFLDELPWMATKNSRLLTTLDYYWNQYWSRDNRIKLIICGSAASWIVDKIISNRGGLHNRITKQICLLPFNLSETKSFLEKRDIRLTHNQITQIYMATGGVPYYLNNIKKGLSASQNIDLLAFTKDGLLAQEFDHLFAALFDMHELSVQIITIIAERKSGVSQEEIFKKVDDINIKGKLGLQKLKELESAGFIMKFKPYMHKTRGIYYKVIDEYTLFYLSWIKPIKESLTYKAGAGGYWEIQQSTPAWYSWAGIAFESICHKHIDQIRDALHLDVSAIPNAWKFTGKGDQSGAQVDLLFDRRDDAITLCEIKFTNKSFYIDKTYAQNIENKIQAFRRVTRTRKQIFFTMISAYGIKNSKYADELVAQVVVLEDLFRDV